MIDAIIYNSKTGFTKQYAYSFAVSSGLPIYDLKDIRKLAKGSSVIYFSWIMAAKITKIKKLKDYNIVMVCAVGMMKYSPEYTEQIKKDNFLTSDCYYLRGGLRLSKLPQFQRFILSFVRKELQKKQKQNKLNTEDAEFLACLEKGSEDIELDRLGPLIEWYNEKQSIIC